MTALQPLVVAASVAVKWFTTARDSARALGLLSGGHRLLGPDLLPVEIGNVIWKRTLRGDLQPEQARAMIADVAAGLVAELVPSSPLMPAALEIALRYERTVYDSLYLALAVAQRCRLVTADERLVNRLQGIEMEPFIVTLGRY